MASVFKKEGSRFWYACFSLPSGKRVYRSTKATSQKKARIIADAWEAAACEARTVAQVRRVVEDAVGRVRDRQRIHETARVWLTRWLDRRRPETAADTWSAYSHTIREFLEAAGPAADGPMADIDTEIVRAWRDRAAARKSATTVNNRVKHLRIALRAAVEEGILLEDPSAALKPMKEPRTEARRPFTVEELQRVLAVADPEWRGMIYAGLYTGQRLRDLALLTWSHVDLERGELALTTRKTGKRIVLPLAPPLRRCLESLAGDDPRGHVFPRLAALGAKQAGPLSSEFFDLLGAAGLVVPRARAHQAAKEGPGRSGRRQVHPLSFHSLRHTATTLLKAAGASDVVARDIVGHDSRAVSRAYTHLPLETKLAALSLLPDLG